MNEIIEAHKAYCEAYSKVWHTTKEAVLHGSEERKEMYKAEKAFLDAVRDSEYDEIFTEYASLTGNY